LGPRLLEEPFNHPGVHFASGVVQDIPAAIQEDHVRDVPPVVLLHELLLSRRPQNVEIDYSKVDSISILVVEINGPSGLPLGVKTAPHRK
jgi:hypothetical protein